MMLSVQFSSVTQSCPTLCDPMDCSMPGFPVLHHLLEFAWIISIELVVPSNHLILSYPLLLMPSIFPSIRVFSNESALQIKVAKVLELQLQLQNIQCQISFMIDWFDLHAVSQEYSPTLKFKNISLLVLSLLYVPTLTSIHDYWKNHSFD